MLNLLLPFTSGYTRSARTFFVTGKHLEIVHSDRAGADRRLLGFDHGSQNSFRSGEDAGQGNPILSSRTRNRSHP